MVRGAALGRFSVDATLKRVAPLSGAVVVALEVIGSALVMKGSPAFGAKPAQISAYFADPTSHVMLGIFLLLIAAPFWFIYLGCLYGAVKVKEGGVGRLATTLVATGSAGAAIGVAADAFTAMASFRASHETLTPVMATVYFDAANVLTYTGFAVAMSGFNLALGVASLRYGAVVPTWIGASSIVLAVFLLIPIISWAAITAGLLVTLYASVVMYREKAGDL
jgi:hypothetical protein